MTSGGGRLIVAIALLCAACSPEARRTRDGGAGADPGNKILVEHQGPDPHAADTTLWPGRATAPVDLLARGIIAPPSYPPAAHEGPPSPSRQRMLEKSSPPPEQRTNRP